jgi:cytoskeletal protein CcmA (bactofilin family)
MIHDGLTMGLFGKKTRKKTRNKTVVTALIGSSTHIDNKFLSFTGGIHIHGHVGLDVVAGEDKGTAVSILEGGEVDGDVRAVDIFIAGTVNGNVYAAGHLQLTPSARVLGDVEYASLDIADGAVVHGTARKK